jgi:hypothetical protein
VAVEKFCLLSKDKSNVSQKLRRQINSVKQIVKVFLKNSSFIVTRKKATRKEQSNMLEKEWGFFK